MAQPDPLPPYPPEDRGRIAAVGLEQRGRPTATLGGTDPLPPIAIPDRDAAKAVAAARVRRTVEEIRVRVRCSGALHTVELVGGRLRLVDHPASDRAFYRDAPLQLPRCFEILKTWGEVRVGRRQTRRAATGRSWRERYFVVAHGKLPQPLARARVQAAGEGQERRDHVWLGIDTLQANSIAHRQAALLVRLEYARLRRHLLLEVPPAKLEVSVTDGGTPHTVGMVWPDVDGHGDKQHEGWIQITVCRNWGPKLLWEGLGVVDGRVVLDVAGNGPQPVALLIDWAGRTQWGTDTTTVAGDTATIKVPLVRDQDLVGERPVAGRWHLADPTAGTRMRFIAGQLCQ
jgi:hypothetical protein